MSNLAKAIILWVICGVFNVAWLMSQVFIASTPEDMRYWPVTLIVLGPFAFVSGIGGTFAILLWMLLGVILS